MTPTTTRVIYPALPDPLTPGDLYQLFSPIFDERKWAPTMAKFAQHSTPKKVQLDEFLVVRVLSSLLPKGFISVPGHQHCHIYGELFIAESKVPNRFTYCQATGDMCRMVATASWSTVATF